jgi:UDP-N-acetylmuramoyl-tripeptide--D-alanyl-D-alanine ligase
MSLGLKTCTSDLYIEVCIGLGGLNAYNRRMKKIIAGLVLGYFRLFAKIQLRKIGPDVVGITGSEGKTTAMSALEALLKDKYALHVTKKANSESGIPLSILGLSPTDYSPLDWLRLLVLAPFKLLINWRRYDKLIVEMGIDSPLPPKNMEYLLRIVSPRVGIFLNALAVHSEPFDGLVKEIGDNERREKIIDLIAQEKGKLIASLPKNGLAVLYGDDKRVLAFAKKTAARVITFGKKDAYPGVDTALTLRDYLLGSKGTQFTFEYKGEVARLDLPYLLPEHMGLSLAAALCLGVADEGMKLNEAAHILEQGFNLSPGRAGMFEGIKGSMIIDSSYNASAQPMLDMLELLKGVPGKRKVAVLGDMRELGQESQIEHERVARKALEVGEVIYLVGPLMQEFALPVFQEQMEGKKVRWFVNARLAGGELVKEIGKGDVVLVKGSQNTLYLEEVVEMLLANKQDQKHLCRRGKYWNTVRMNYFERNI